MSSDIQSWGSSETSPSGGVYELYESSADDYIWSQRLTRDQQYTDDQLFEFTDLNGGCHVDGESRSEANSVYDYNVNFCNLWNVYNGAGGFSNLEHTFCTYYVDDSEAPVTCARY
eukprot:CAMPEP_0116876906 /NCGR_PEP_ID=MMETSP0463-20121206/8765_1 /TAXON_ID=181622 /ORGANISM="Strombidinopsis sp, Strain SopsisLIS2011" /LENGTH=114 /DNA_ID=CAMNT_0004523813 /DNA_START=165 /DNA_END=509 /DNA_ORIENTATION=+